VAIEGRDQGLRAIVERAEVDGAARLVDEDQVLAPLRGGEQLGGRAAARAEREERRHALGRAREAEAQRSAHDRRRDLGASVEEDARVTDELGEGARDLGVPARGAAIAEGRPDLGEDLDDPGVARVADQVATEREIGGLDASPRGPASALGDGLHGELDRRITEARPDAEDDPARVGIVLGPRRGEGLVEIVQEALPRRGAERLDERGPEGALGIAQHVDRRVDRRDLVIAHRPRGPRARAARANRIVVEPDLDLRGPLLASPDGARLGVREAQRGGAEDHRSRPIGAERTPDHALAELVPRPIEALKQGAQRGLGGGLGARGERVPRASSAARVRARSKR
jgi:hypothetical protein